MSTGRYYNQLSGEYPKRKRWKSGGWPRGENSFSEDNEIRSDEFYLGVNLEIVGKSSIRLPRRGTNEFVSTASSSFNGWGVYKDPVNSVNLLLFMVGGRLYKVTTGGTITEIDNAITWDTAARMRGVLVRGYFYFGNSVDYMSKTDGNTITQWTARTAPTFNSAVATVAGTANTIRGYAITTVTANGETEISTEKTTTNERTLDASNYDTLNFNRDTNSNVVGYNVYMALSGGTLLLLHFIDQPTSGTTVTFVNDGNYEQSLIYEAPTFNTTGGVKGNLFAEYANTLFVAGNLAEPDAVFYGGTGAKYESFSPSDNGGWVKPGRGDGDSVTQMIGFDDFLLIFKNNSIWKFIFGGDGGPTLSAVIPQYGTSSPDSVQRFEKDIVYLGTDGRIRITGYEPNQLNVIRTADISNRIQDRIDESDPTYITDWHGLFHEQKYLLCNKTMAFPYDRRYVGFLGRWTNYDYDSFIEWDQGTNKLKAFGFKDGSIYELMVDNTYTDDGTAIEASIRLRREDAGDDGVVKWWPWSKFKFKAPVGQLTLTTYIDNTPEVDILNLSTSSGGGIETSMFDEVMFDEGSAVALDPTVIQLLHKIIEKEAYSIYHQFDISGNDNNHAILQSANGIAEVEDSDYLRDETVI